jgi:tetratricopeptide (TPR) repeat protein
VVNRGLYIKNETDLLSKIPAGRQSPVTAWKIDSHRRELAAMGTRFAACGRWVMQAGDENLAGKWLELAPAVSGSPEIVALAGRMERMRGPRVRPPEAPPRRQGPLPAAGGKGEKAPQARAAAMLARARALYSSGALAQAEKLWKEVLALDPGNREAAKGLERAARVRQRLKALASGRKDGHNQP